MDLNKELTGFRSIHTGPEYSVLRLAQLPIVFASEDVPGENHHNFDYIDTYGKVKNFGKSLTTHFVLRDKEAYTVVTRHNRSRTFGVLPNQRAAMIYLFGIKDMTKTIIWKDNNLYKLYMEERLLDSI